MKNVDFNDINEDELEFLASSIYEYLNGRINPMIRSVDMKVSEPRMCSIIDNRTDGSIVGLQIGNIIYVNLKYINDQNDRVRDQSDYHEKLSPKWYTSALFEIIAHELSHLEQEIDYTEYAISEEYREYIEMTNVKNTFHWLKTHTDDIKRYFPNYDYETSIGFSSYAKDKSYAKYKLNQYKRSKSYCDEFIGQLSYMTRCTNIREMFKLAIDKGIKGFGFFDIDWIDDDICVIGSFDEILTNEYIAKSALTYISEKIIGAYGEFTVYWDISDQHDVLTLVYHKFADKFHGNVELSTIFMCKNDNSELKFVHDFHDERIPYSGTITTER